VADLIKRASPVAWQHINLRGRYLFKNQKQHGVNLAEIIDSLGETTIENGLTKENWLLN